MFHFWVKYPFKGLVQFEINFKSAYLKGIQDVGVFVSTVFSILTFFGQTGVVCQSYFRSNRCCLSVIWCRGGPPQRACTEKSKLNMI